MNAATDIRRFQRLLAARLLIWSGLSVFAGGWLLLLGGAWLQGMGVQAMVWGVVDAAIALFALRSLGRQTATDPALEAARLRSILQWNTALDVLYVAAGAGIVMALGAGDAFWAGTGWGVIVQGGFLFVFDLIHAAKIPRQ